jgi:hypothetical protein
LKEELTVSTQTTPYLTGIANSLQIALDALKSECATAFKEYHSARKSGYTNIARTFLWWNEAKGYSCFDALTGGTETSNGRAVNHGHNFSPLLKHLFGSLLSDQHRNKMSRALNALQKEYETNADMYAVQAEVKLANFIHNKGGFVQLIKGTYSKAELKFSNDRELAAEISIDEYEQRVADEASVIEAEMAGWNFKYKLIPRYTVKETRRVKEEVITEKLLPDAKAHLNCSIVEPSATFGGSMVTNLDGYAIALVKRENNQYTLLNNLIDKSLVNSSIVNAYRKKFDACPTSTRILCETLRTQLLPASLKLKQKDLVQVIPDSNNSENEVLARPRLMYLGKTGELVLSPLHLKAGVVTTVKPKAMFMDAPNYDVALTGISKSTVEQTLLNQLAFNLYSPDHFGKIPALPNDPVYSHRLCLTHKADEKSQLLIHFNSFAQEPQFAYEQPIYDNAYDSQLVTRIDLKPQAVEAISKRVAEMWLQGIDDHITREANLQMQITVTGKCIYTSHTQKDGKFIVKNRVVYDPEGVDENVLIDQRFLTKDLMPVLASLGHIPFDGAVSFKLGKHVLVLEFTTDVANYCIAIPTLDLDTKTLCVNAFKSYTPVIAEKTAAQMEEAHIEALVGDHELNDYSIDGAIVTHDDIETIYVEI